MHLPTRLALPLCFSLLLTACHEAPPSAPLAPVVLIAEAKPRSALHQSFHGEVRAKHEFDLAFRINGKLRDRLVDVGSPVKAQQALAHLDPSDQALSLAAAQAQWQAAKSDQQTAEADQKRYADLLSKQFVSQAAYDAKVNQSQAAEARLKQAQANLGQQTHQQNYTILTSDQPAIVTALLADAGQVVAAGQPVFRLALPDSLEISVAIPESRRSELKVGMPASATLSALGEKHFAARLRELSPLADSSSRTFNARFQLRPPLPEGIALGMTAQISLENPSKTAPLHLPARAVIHQGKDAVVWVIDNNQQVQPRTVQTGILDETGIEILSGLQAGEHFVVTGGERLSPGQTVRPQRQVPAEAQR